MLLELPEVHYWADMEHQTLMVVAAGEATTAVVVVAIMNLIICAEAVADLAS
jgi:hypothetical protein